MRSARGSSRQTSPGRRPRRRRTRRRRCAPGAPCIRYRGARARRRSAPWLPTWRRTTAPSSAARPLPSTEATRLGEEILRLDLSMKDFFGRGLGDRNIDSPPVASDRCTPLPRRGGRNNPSPQRFGNSIWLLEDLDMDLRTVRTAAIAGALVAPPAAAFAQNNAAPGAPAATDTTAAPAPAAAP